MSDSASRPGSGSWAFICSLIFAVVAASCGNGGSSEMQSPAASTGSAESPDRSAPPSPVADMERVPAGMFIYGATEEQFQALIAQSRMGFPGMKDLLRSALVIPPQSLSLNDFWMDDFEVTNRQFAEFVNATNYRPSSSKNFLKHWEASSYPDWAADFPVVWVSEEDAQAYCRWRKGHLPTDQEWEKAVRGPGGRLFPWGNTLPDRETCNVGTGKIEPVGNRPGDRSQYGIYDLGGNVSELIGSTVTYQGRPSYVIRGGSYESGIQSLFGFQRQLGVSADDRFETVGFRCVSDHPPEDSQAPSSGGATQ